MVVSNVCVDSQILSVGYDKTLITYIHINMQFLGRHQTMPFHIQFNRIKLSHKTILQDIMWYLDEYLVFILIVKILITGKK